MAASVADIVSTAHGSALTAVATALVAIAASTAIVGLLTIVVGVHRMRCRIRCKLPWVLLHRADTGLTRAVLGRCQRQGVLQTPTIMKAEGTLAGQEMSWIVTVSFSTNAEDLCYDGVL